MDHRRDVVLDHLLVDWIPIAVAEPRVLPMTAGWIGVQVDADKSVLVDASVDLGDAVFRRDFGALRQHRHADKVLREKHADAVDQLVAGAGPGFAGSRIAEMMTHAGRTWGKD